MSLANSLRGGATDNPAYCKVTKTLSYQQLSAKLEESDAFSVIVKIRYRA